MSERGTMRITIDGKVYRLVEIVSGADESAEPTPEPRPVWPGDEVVKSGQRYEIIGKDGESNVWARKGGTYGAVGIDPIACHHPDGAPVSGLVDQRRRRTKDEPPTKENADWSGYVRSWDTEGTEDQLTWHRVVENPNSFPEWQPCEPRRWSDD